MKIQNLNRNELNSIMSDFIVEQDIGEIIESDNQLIQNLGGEDEGFIYHIAINESEIIGYCFSSGSLINGNRHIRNIHVAETFRQNGVAENLLNEIFGNAVLKKHKRIRAEISELTDGVFQDSCRLKFKFKPPHFSHFRD